MNKDLIEVVARAIYEFQPHHQLNDDLTTAIIKWEDCIQCVYTNLAKAAIQAIEAYEDAPTASSIYEAIKHGDEQHRQWLKDAMDNIFAGKPVPEQYDKQQPDDVSKYGSEPTFILRAADRLSAPMIKTWAMMAECYGVSEEKRKSATDIADVFEKWQDDNPDKCKIPD